MPNVEEMITDVTAHVEATLESADGTIEDATNALAQSEDLSDDATADDAEDDSDEDEEDDADEDETEESTAV